MSNPFRVRINCYQNGGWLPDLYGFKHNSVVETQPVANITQPDKHGHEIWVKPPGREKVLLTDKDYTII